MRILGIDPGLRFTGWAIIEEKGNTLTSIAHGVIKTKSNENFSLRLKAIYQELDTVLKNFAINEMAVEEVFVNKNPDSTLKLGMARGVALVVGANNNVPLSEYGANKVKKTVVGVGHAKKDQVAFLIKRLLPTIDVTTLEKEDITDAYAVALCHYQHRGINRLVG